MKIKNKWILPLMVSAIPLVAVSCKEANEIVNKLDKNDNNKAGDNQASGNESNTSANGESAGNNTESSASGSNTGTDSQAGGSENEGARASSNIEVKAIEGANGKSLVPVDVFASNSTSASANAEPPVFEDASTASASTSTAVVDNRTPKQKTVQKLEKVLKSADNIIAILTKTQFLDLQHM
ncbi:hypothetical protein ACJA23_01585 [Mycoplasma corogypsi]|uniref:hypothetical protein n=1 Tax=Mycoplasma corogypsi TaxID=2106 RepID=UPI003872B4DE